MGMWLIAPLLIFLTLLGAFGVAFSVIWSSSSLAPDKKKLATGLAVGGLLACLFAEFHCRFEANGKVNVVLVGSTPAGDDPVALVVMKQSEWRTLAACAPADVPRVIFELEPNITGHLPTFIRHLHTVVDAMKLAATALAT